MSPTRINSQLDLIDIRNVLFLDIETVPAYPSFDTLPEPFQELWLQKAPKYSYEQMEPEALYFEKAGIHAEFGKIICISACLVLSDKDSGGYKFRIKAYSGHDEKQLLLDFRKLLDEHYNDTSKHYLCAHNGIEFDFPYLARRMWINEIQLPNLLNVPGSKSWNNRWLLDTMELWRFGDYKDKTSLNLLAACFGIPSPKDDISGKDVAKVYHLENDLERISLYCQKDVATLARLFMRFKQLGMVEDNDVIYVEKPKGD